MPTIIIKLDAKATKAFKLARLVFTCVFGAALFIGLSIGLDVLFGSNDCWQWALFLTIPIQIGIVVAAIAGFAQWMD